jgi:Tat protein secretion system quality control protein TatD with DNase activity
MGPSPPLNAFSGGRLGGVAIMSTHPRDFPLVKELAVSLPTAFPGVKVVPCYGVHPWFLHELHEDSCNQSADDSWLKELEQLVRTTPGAVVGEIGLDAFHFDGETGELTSSIENQVKAFEAQMEIAARLRRPVSIHAVQCFGPLMVALSKLKKSSHGLPPKVYFHAFGGKVGTIDQLLAVCGRQPGQVYFGFAPVVNFRSPKTATVIRKVGLSRLVLETDHEDANLVPGSMEQGISLIADALHLSQDEVVEQTTRNAYDLYSLEE